MFDLMDKPVDNSN